MRKFTNSLADRVEFILFFEGGRGWWPKNKKGNLNRQFRLHLLSDIKLNVYPSRAELRMNN